MIANFVWRFVTVNSIHFPYGLRWYLLYEITRDIRDYYITVAPGQVPRKEKMTMESIEIIETTNLTFYWNTTFYINGTEHGPFVNNTRSAFQAFILVLFPILFALSMALCVCTTLIKYGNFHRVFMTEYSPAPRNRTREPDPDQESNDASFPRHFVEPASVPFSQA